MRYLSKAAEYRLESRHISGTHREKLEQIDQAIQELLDLKLLECAPDEPHVRFLAVPRQSHWFAMTVTILALLIILVLLLGTRSAFATPSTTYWAPSTASCQARGIPHVTYDTYFRKGPSAGSQGAPNYPIDTGLTIGVLPFAKIQSEVGFDLLLPSQDPLFLNAKLCTPESALFKGSPAISAGIYNLGFKEGVTDYNVLHLMFQKAMPIGGYIAAGLYHGRSSTLFTNSEGKVVKTGAMLGVLSPDVQIGVKGLRKINLAADVQTGKNVLGAWGFGANLYFADNVSLLVGPVFFLDSNLQPGGSKHMWTAQLDVDIPLGR